MMLPVALLLLLHRQSPVSLPIPHRPVMLSVLNLLALENRRPMRLVLLPMVIPIVLPMVLVLIVPVVMPLLLPC